VLTRVRQLARSGALFALSARAAGSFVMLLLAFALGRLAGASGTGTFFVYLSWMNVAAAVCGMGVSLYVLREIATLETRGDRAAGQALLLKGIGAVLACGLTLLGAAHALGGEITGPLLGRQGPPRLLELAAFGGLGMAVLRTLVEAMKARGHVSAGLLVEHSLVPGGVLVGVLLLAYAGTVREPTAVPVLHALSIVALIVVAARALWDRHAGAAASPTTLPVRSLAPLWAIGLANHALVAAPYLVLPHFATLADVGQFAVAHRLVGLGGTIHMALASFFAPRFAALHALGDATGLRRAYRRSQAYSLAAYTPLFLLLLTFPAFVLSIFGAEFRAGVGVLIVLAAGRLLNALAGVPDYFLAMTGRQGADLVVALGALLVFGVLAAALGPPFGAAGVAGAFAIGLGARGLTSMILVGRYLERIPESGAVTRSQDLFSNRLPTPLVPGRAE
jgi:O-antigen/teichoic acid export membrane protein